MYESTLFWAGTYEVNITLTPDNNGAQGCDAAVGTDGGAFVARIQFASAAEVTFYCIEADGEKVPEMLDIGAESVRSLSTQPAHSAHRARLCGHCGSRIMSRRGRRY